MFQRKITVLRTCIGHRHPDSKPSPKKKKLKSFNTYLNLVPVKYTKTIFANKSDI